MYWYIAQLATEPGLDLDAVAEGNLRNRGNGRAGTSRGRETTADRTLLQPHAETTGKRDRWTPAVAIRLNATKARIAERSRPPRRDQTAKGIQIRIGD